MEETLRLGGVCPSLPCVSCPLPERRMDDQPTDRAKRDVTLEQALCPGRVEGGDRSHPYLGLSAVGRVEEEGGGCFAAFLAAPSPSFPAVTARFVRRSVIGLSCRCARCTQARSPPCPFPRPSPQSMNSLPI